MHLFFYAKYLQSFFLILYLLGDMKKKRFEKRTDLVFHFLRGSIPYFLIAVFFACMVSLLDLINPKLIGYTVDTVLGDKPSDMPPFFDAWVEHLGGVSFLRTHLVYIALTVVLVACGAAFCRYMFRLNNSKGAEKLVKTMRDDLFSHILRLPFKWHSENHTGDIIQRCTSDVEQIKMFLSEQLTSLIRVLVLIIMAMYFMFSIEKNLALAAAAYIPIIVGYSFFFHRKIGSAFQKVDEEEGKLSSIAQENLTGVRVVRAFGREKYERERFEKQNTNYTGMWVYLLKVLAAFWASGDLFSNLQILTILSYGAYLCVHGQLTAGNYIEFISYNAMLTWPIRMLGRVISNLSKAGISIDRIMYIMNAEEERDIDGALEPSLEKDIVFDHVSYQYENGNTDVLHDISFTIPAGTTFGILGATGSGKSTLAYLLDRLYTLPENNGKITIGGVDIANMKASYLRSNIGMVLQEPYLFSRTLKENIRIANQQASMKDVRTASRIAALEEAVNHFTEGYETFVGERGVTLSGGQKQRTAIAQMLIRKPPIMIFDDSLSAVDAETDAKIRKALQENIGSSTVILIAHRITTLMNADNIIVMDKGRIVESGTHASLLEKNGIYRKIYDLQSQQTGEEA